MIMDLYDLTVHDYVEQETRALDVVASWETLCEAYRMLEFSDEISDAVRLEEFKWIIKEMNKFLTRMKKKLLSCENAKAMRSALIESFTPTGKVTVDNRQSLVFQKLRQRWIKIVLQEITQMEEREEEDSEDGWTDESDE